MPHRFLIRLAPALAILALAAAAPTPARADDAYDGQCARDSHRTYDQYARDRRDDYRHHLRDGLGGLGHGVGDLLRYGTTKSFSSPRHYYKDRHRADHHYLRDRHRDYEHSLRDRYRRYDRHIDDRYGPRYPY